MIPMALSTRPGRTTGRAILAALLLAGWQTGCVSDDPGVTSPPSRVRHGRHQPVLPRRGAPPPRRTAAKPIDGEAPWYPRGRKISRRWRAIVIHHSATSAGGAKSFDKYHRERNGWDELGYHFVIGNGSSTPNGWVEVGPRWHKQKHGAHCKTPTNYYNEHGIGVCLVGNFSETRPTEKQLAALDHLLRFLRDVTDIPPSRIITHREVTRKTRCPGRYFRVAAVRRSLLTPPAATSLP